MVISGLDDIIMVTLIGTGCNLVPITVTGKDVGLDIIYLNSSIMYFNQPKKLVIAFTAILCIGLIVFAAKSKPVNSCGGVALIGNFFANTNKVGNFYSILWTKSPVTGTVSMEILPTPISIIFLIELKLNYRILQNIVLQILKYINLTELRRILFRELKPT